MLKKIFKSLGAFEVKEVEGESRTFMGVAATAGQDRAMDILVPSGVIYALPIPLLMQHNLEEPVGEVIEVEITDIEIRVKFTLPEIQEEGELKKIVDKAYQSIKYNLIKGLSVGFMADFDSATFNENGGVTFESWEWYELSLVTVPCNRDAQIEKSILEHNNSCKEKSKSVQLSNKPVKLSLPKRNGVKL